MKRIAVIAGLAVGAAAMTGCTPGQIGVWLNWYEADPDAAVEFANEPTGSRSR